jgi:hypothetical protein
MELALVNCQLRVTVSPLTMLLLLALKTSEGVFGGGFPEELPEFEPPPQPVKAMSGKIAAKPNRIDKQVASGPILLNPDRRSRLRSFSIIFRFS